jgi:hypothetical protein
MSTLALVFQQKISLSFFLPCPCLLPLSLIDRSVASLGSVRSVRSVRSVLSVRLGVIMRVRVGVAVENLHECIPLSE